MPDRLRRLLARLMLGLALVFGAWTFFLLSVGGFSARIAGLRLSAHGSWRPLALTLLATAGAAAIGGVASTIEILGSTLGVLGRALTRVNQRVVAALLAVVVVALGIAWNARAAGGSDSYGYVSEADLWLSGHLTIAQPWVASVPWPDAAWTFAPLGYRPGVLRGPAGLVDNPLTMVPKYSPGLPLLMALAKGALGQCALYAVVPVSAGLLVVSTFGLGRRMGSSTAGLIAAWLVATSPTMLFMTMQPMSDVPVAAAWAIAFYLLLADGVGTALAAGVAAAVAVLIRPNLVPVAAIIVVWLGVSGGTRVGSDRRRRMWQAATFASVLMPAVVWLGWLNQFWYGAPLRSGYESFRDLFQWSNLVPNARHYAAWFIETQTPVAVLGVAALMAPRARVWPARARGSVVLLLALTVLFFWTQYCLYQAFNDSTYLRFFLPTWPFLMIGIATVLVWPARSGRPVAAAAAALVSLGLGLHTLRAAIDFGTFGVQQGERKYAAIGRIARDRTDPNAVLLSLQHSGSLRYYAGRMTLVFGNLDRGWLDRAVAWLASHDAHPYAVLEDWEVDQFRDRFGAQNAVGRLAMNPIVEYDGSRTIFVFDLLRTPGSTAPVERIVETYGSLGCPAPAPPHAFEIKN